MKDTKLKEAFISHASEDKDSFVRPLAEYLEKQGIEIWYDEYSLKVGDSLSEQIDAGLSQSKYAVLVLSKVYFEKFWAKEELKGIRALVSANQTKILPIWFGISRDEIIAKSPMIADIVAINANVKTVEAVGEELIQVIKPEVFRHIHRRNLLLSQLDNSEAKMINISDIKIAPRRVQKLTIAQSSRIRNLKAALDDVRPLSIEEWEDGFMRDLFPEREILWWETIASCYNKFNSFKSFSLNEKAALFEGLVDLYSLNKADNITRLIVNFDEDTVSRAKNLLSETKEFLSKAFSEEFRESLYMPHGD